MSDPGISSIADVVPKVQLAFNDTVVSIELHCTSAYAARLVFEDCAARMNGGDSLVLRIKADGAGEKVE